MNDKTTREILLIKEKYGIRDDDPIFVLLEVYGTLQNDLIHSIKQVEMTNKTAAEGLKKQQDALAIAMHLFEKLPFNIRVKTDRIDDGLDKLIYQINEYKNLLIKDSKAIQEKESSHNLVSIIDELKEDIELQKDENLKSMKLIIGFFILLFLYTCFEIL